MRHEKSKPKFQRSDIPYKDRLLMQKYQNIAAHRDEAAKIAMQVACVALNDTEGLGYMRLSRFAKRLAQLGFIVKDGRMYAAENAETGDVVPVKALCEQEETK